MATKNSRVQRIPKEIVDDLNNALTWRFKNNLISRRDFNLTEGFRLVKRMPEWNMAMEKLKIFPKKEDLYGRFKKK